MNSQPHSRSRLALIIIAVTDLDRAARFYDASFTWQRVVDTPVYIEYECGGSLHFGIYERASFARNTGILPQECSGGSTTATELYLVVDDARAAIDRLIAAGARLLAPLALRDWGDEVAYLRGPDGNVIAIAQERA